MASGHAFLYARCYMPRGVSKTTRPAPKGVAARARLFRRMDQLVRKHSVVWVSAPAGSGKTTLAASWLVARRRRSLWYQVDARDADPATFFYYLRDAVVRLAPRCAERLPLLTPEYALGLEAYARNFFEVVGARVPCGTILVVDDFQSAERAPLEALLPSALGALAGGLGVVVLGRSAPPPSFARLVAEGAVGFLGAEELDLTPEETCALIRSRARKPLAVRAAADLQARTGGWMAGTVLLLETATRLPARRGAETAPQQVLFDYFATEIFDRAPPETQRLLLAASLLADVSVPSAEALAGEPRAGDILRDLVARSYFTVRLDGEEPRYRFHPLFREFLLARARSTFPAEELSRLRRVAAEKLEVNGSWEDAARLLAEAGAWPELGAVVVRHGAELLRQGRTQTLEAWLRAIPATALEVSPWLLYWLGAAVLATDVAESRSRFEAAFRLFAPRGDACGSALAWCGVVDTYIYELGDLAPLDGWIAEGEALLERHPRFASPDTEARFTYSMFCALMFRPAGHPQLRSWEERARALALGSGDAFLRASLSAHLVWHHAYWSGDQPKAAAVAHRLRESVRSAGAGPFYQVTAQWAEAAHCHATAALGRCSAMVEEGLRLSERTGVRLFDSWLVMHGCWSALSAEDFAAADDYLRRLWPVAGAMRRSDAGCYHATLGWRALCGGDARAALQHHRTALEHFREADFQIGLAIGPLFLSESLIELGSFDEARSCLEEGHRVALQIGSKACQYLYWLFDALLCLRRGEPEPARRAVRQHLSIAKETGILNHVGWRPAVMSALYALALDAGIERELVRSQIRRRKLVPPAHACDVEGWPWRLRVRTLGGFELFREGEPVAFGPKPPRKPLELLQAIVALGGDGIPEEALVDRLWPDAEGDAGQHAIETTLHRLRRLIDAPGAVVQSGRRISLDPKSCFSDVGALQRRLAAAFDRRAIARLDAEAVRSEAERVLSLYRGPLLPRADSAWALEARERLRSQVARYLHGAAQQLDRVGDRAGADELMRRGLEADAGLRLQVRSVA
jgi:LuxR family transcriptional regulator, maltose regulon positive regulatory protein